MQECAIILYLMFLFIGMCICAWHMKYNCWSHFIALEIMKNRADAGVHIGKAEEKLYDDNKMYIIYCRIICMINHVLFILSLLIYGHMYIVVCEINGVCLRYTVCKVQYVPGDIILTESKWHNLVYRTKINCAMSYFILWAVAECTHAGSKLPAWPVAIDTIDKHT